MFDFNAIDLTFYLIPLGFLVVTVLGCAFLGCWLAGKKGYSQVAWFYLCFFLGMFALLTLGFAPMKIKKQNPQEQESRKNPQTA